MATRKINKIIIHCSATPADMDIGAKTIRKWHVEGNGWSDIGYHWVIRRDGTIEKGRDESIKGAHCAAKNGNVASIGICMVGGVKRSGSKLLTENNFTPAQWTALEAKVRELMKKYPIDTLLGHRDLESGKDCPSFSVRDWAMKHNLIQLTWR